MRRDEIDVTFLEESGVFALLRAMNPKDYMKASDIISVLFYFMTEEAKAALDDYAKENSFGAQKHVYGLKIFMEQECLKPFLTFFSNHPTGLISGMAKYLMNKDYPGTEPDFVRQELAALEAIDRGPGAAMGPIVETIIVTHWKLDFDKLGSKWETVMGIA